MTRWPRSRRARWSRRLAFADSPLDAVAGADAVVLVTEWPEFVELDWKRVAGGDGAATLVVDGRNAAGSATRYARLASSTRAYGRR